MFMTPRPTGHCLLALRSYRITQYLRTMSDNFQTTLKARTTTTQQISADRRLRLRIRRLTRAIPTGEYGFTLNKPQDHIHQSDLYTQFLTHLQISRLELGMILSPGLQQASTQSIHSRIMPYPLLLCDVLQKSRINMEGHTITKTALDRLITRQDPWRVYIKVKIQAQICIFLQNVENPDTALAPFLARRLENKAHYRRLDQVLKRVVPWEEAHPWVKATIRSEIRWRMLLEVLGFRR